MKIKDFSNTGLFWAIVLVIVLIIIFWKQISKALGFSTPEIPICDSLGLDQTQIDTLKAQGKCIDTKVAGGTVSFNFPGSPSWNYIKNLQHRNDPKGVICERLDGSWYNIGDERTNCGGLINGVAYSPCAPTERCTDNNVTYGLNYSLV